MQLREICTKLDVCLLYFDLALVVESHQLHELIIRFRLASQNDPLAEGHNSKKRIAATTSFRLRDRNSMTNFIKGRHHIHARAAGMAQLS